MMSTESNARKSPLDMMKWLLAIALFAAAVVGNYLYSDSVFLYRLLAVLTLSLLSFAVALTTVKGRSFLVLLKEANIERRKVIWPTRQETTQTTMIVVAVVIFMALVLWGLDSLLGWIVSLLIG